MGPYSTTHIATQINIKFSSQNLFAVGIIQMAHKRLVMQRQQRQSTTKRPYLLYTFTRIIRTWCVWRAVTRVRTGTAPRTRWHISLHFLIKWGMWEKNNMSRREQVIRFPRLAFSLQSAWLVSAERHLWSRRRRLVSWPCNLSLFCPLSDVGGRDEW